MTVSWNVPWVIIETASQLTATRDQTERCGTREPDGTTVPGRPLAYSSTIATVPSRALIASRELRTWQTAGRGHDLEGDARLVAVRWHDGRNTAVPASGIADQRARQ